MRDADHIAVITDYKSLREALRARCEAIGLSRESLDDLAGLASGHSGKLLGRGHSKRFGNVSLGCVLGALGVKLVLVEDEEAVARMRRRWVPRDERYVHRRASA